MKSLLPLFSKKGKTLLLSAAFCAAAPAAFASHIIGGELTAKHISGNNYEIRLTHYRDLNGAAFAPYMTYTIRTDNMTGVPSVVFRTDTLMRNPSMGDTILSSASFVFESGVFVDTVQLPPAHYWISTKECCRNANIVNMASPSSMGLGLVAEIDVPTAGGDSGPQYLTPPMPFYAQNAVANYNPLPYDADGDSLVWMPVVPLQNETWNSGPTVGQPVTAYVQPPTNAAYPLTVNPVSGNISMKPTTTGMFTYAFKVDAYRNGVKAGSAVRDYTFIVMPTDTAAVPVLTPSANVQYDTTDKVYYVDYTPGQPLSFSVTGTVGTALAPLEMKAFSALFQNAGPQFGITAIGGNSLTGTFTWTPATGFNQTVTMVMRGKNSYLQTDFTVLLKRSSTPTAVVSTQKPSSKLYPNPNSGAFKLELSGNATHLKVDVINPMGQQVARIYEGQATTGMKLSFSEALPKGLYFVRVQSHTGKTEVLPLLIQE